MSTKQINLLQSQTQSQSQLNNFHAQKYEELNNDIVENIVIPNLRQDAQTLSVWRIRWRNISNFFEALVKIMVGISTVLAYSSGYYNKPVLAYYSGLTGTIALVFGEFASYCKKVSHERTNLFNRLLAYLNIAPIPDTTENEAVSQSQNQTQRQNYIQTPQSHNAKPFSSSSSNKNIILNKLGDVIEKRVEKNVEQDDCESKSDVPI